MINPGTPIAVGQSQTKSELPRKRLRVTAENAVNAAIYDPSILPMWLYHQKFLSEGGRRNFLRSPPPRNIPIVPKTTETTPMCPTTAGLNRPNEKSKALATKVKIAANQSKNLGPWPCWGRLRKSTRYPEKAA